MTRVLGKPGFCIVTDIARPYADKLAALGRYPVSIVGDGLGRRGVMHAAIKALDQKSILCGPAVTVEVRAGDNLMIHAALAIAKRGDVLVVNAHGDTDAGLWGGLMTRSALKLGLAGIVIDGAIRDRAEIVEFGFPTFARGASPCGGDKEGPGQVNRPISCGGVPVNPGDVILGDGDGVIVVPSAMLDEALAGATARHDAEARRVSEIEKGLLHQSWLLSTLRKAGVLGADESL
jgi:4-hydroxy-4-methyl-2-oxoglutarate aldolase